MKTILKSSKSRNKTRPVECGARIGLAPRGNITVPGDPLAGQLRVGLQQGSGDSDQRLILRIGKGSIVSSFQLDADREVIARLALLKAGFARMPGAAVKGHELGHATVTLDQQMRRHLQPVDLFKERVPARFQPVGKQFGDMTAAKLPGRQADIVNHQQRDLAVGTIIAIGRRDVPRSGDAVVSDGKARLVQRVYSGSILRLPYFR